MIDTISYLAGWLSALLFIAALVLGVIRGVGQLRGTQPYTPLQEQPQNRDYYIILAWVVATGVFVYAFGMWSNITFSGASGSLGDIFNNTFIRSDAPHYLSIAEFGYQTEGDPANFIVFFPLFPWLVRLFQLVTRNYVIAAVLLNNVLLYLGCIVVYELGCMDYGRKTSLRAVRLLLLFPAAFFFRSAFTESLFLFLTALALYLCRKERFVFAGLAGLLAALTRMSGIVVLGVIIIEAFIKAWEQTGGFKKGFLAAFAKRAWPFALVICGTLIYLLINKVVTGDAFTFSAIQWEHWHNEFRIFPYQVENIMQYALRNTEARTAGLWSSQFIALQLFLVLAIYGYNKLRVSQTAYNLAYYLGSTSISWLLSAPRYLMCMFPSFYALAMLGEKKPVDIAISLLSFAGLAYLLAEFAMGHSIY